LPSFLLFAALPLPYCPHDDGSLGCHLRFFRHLPFLFPGFLLLSSEVQSGPLGPRSPLSFSPPRVYSLPRCLRDCSSSLLSFPSPSGDWGLSPIESPFLPFRSKVLLLTSRVLPLCFFPLFLHRHKHWFGLLGLFWPSLFSIAEVFLHCPTVSKLRREVLTFCPFLLPLPCAPFFGDPLRNPVVGKRACRILSPPLFTPCCFLLSSFSLKPTPTVLHLSSSHLAPSCDGFSPLTTSPWFT